MDLGSGIAAWRVTIGILSVCLVASLEFRLTEYGSYGGDTNKAMSLSRQYPERVIQDGLLHGAGYCLLYTEKALGRMRLMLRAGSAYARYPAMCLTRVA